MTGPCLCDNDVVENSSPSDPTISVHFVRRHSTGAKAKIGLRIFFFLGGAKPTKNTLNITF